MAIRTNGSNGDYQRTTNLPSSIKFSFCFWIYQIAATDVMVPWIFFDNGTGSYYILYNSGGVLTLDQSATTVSLATMAQNTWYFVAVTCSAAAANALIGYQRGLNDSWFTTGTLTGVSFTGSLLMDIGSNQGTGNFWDGRLAAFKLWDVVLSPTELMKESLSIYPARRKDLRMFTPLFNPGDDEKDYFQGFDWTVSGTITEEAGPDGIPLYPVFIRRGASVTAGVDSVDIGYMLNYHR